MKIKRKIEKDYEVAFVSICVPFDDDDNIPDDFPAIRGNFLKFDVNSVGVIFSDKFKKDINLYLKVVDRGFYKIDFKYEDYSIVINEDYVPSFIPNEYGDYLTLEIDAKTNSIKNWNKFFTKERIEDYINNINDK